MKMSKGEGNMQSILNRVQAALRLSKEVQERYDEVLALAQKGGSIADVDACFATNEGLYAMVMKEFDSILESVAEM